MLMIAPEGFVAAVARYWKSLLLDDIKSSGYSFLVETLWLCQQYGFRDLREVPIVFEDWRRGSRKCLRTRYGGRP